MKREKTALDVTVSDKEKQDTYTKLMREQTAVLQHKQESQRKQEEMVSQTYQQWFKRDLNLYWMVTKTAIKSTIHLMSILTLNYYLLKLIPHIVALNI